MRTRLLPGKPFRCMRGFPSVHTGVGECVYTCVSLASGGTPLGCLSAPHANFEVAKDALWVASNTSKLLQGCPESALWTLVCMCMQHAQGLGGLFTQRWGHAVIGKGNGTDLCVSSGARMVAEA